MTPSSLVRRLWRVFAFDKGLWPFVTLALAVRFVLLPWFCDPLNFWGFHLTTSFILGGRNPWQMISADPALALENPWGYPPLFLAVTIPAQLLSGGNAYLFGILVRLPLVAADLATGFGLYGIAQQLGLGMRSSRWLAIAYWLNPFVVLISTVWGTTDPLPVLCVIGALYLALRKPASPAMTGLAIGMGVAFKLYPIVLLPVLVAEAKQWKARGILLGFALLPVALSSASVLLVSPSDFLRVMGGFTYAPGGQSGFTNLIYIQLSAAGLSVSQIELALGTAYAALLLAVTWMVGSRRLSLPVASAIILLGIFVAVPRYNQNYFLWPIAPLMVCFAAARWRIWSLLPGVASIVVIAVDALVYNGFGGATGLSYWSMVSGGSIKSASSNIAGGMRVILQTTFLALVVVSITVLFLQSRARPEPDLSLTEDVSPDRGRLGLGGRAALLVLIIGIVTCVGTSVAVNASHYPVTPVDFGTYEVNASQTMVTDDFHSPFPGFTWVTGGSGIQVASRAEGGFVLDTLGTNGTAWISRGVPNSTVSFALTVEVQRVDGNRTMLFTIPTGSVIVQNPNGSLPPGQYRMTYESAADTVVVPLGVVTLGRDARIAVVLNHGGGLVTYGSNASALPPFNGPISVLIGHANRMPDGGGRMVIRTVGYTWPTAVPSDDLFVAVTALGLSATLALLPAVWLVREWKRVQPPPA